MTTIHPVVPPLTTIDHLLVLNRYSMSHNRFQCLPIPFQRVHHPSQLHFTQNLCQYAPSIRTVPSPGCRAIKQHQPTIHGTHLFASIGLASLYCTPQNNSELSLHCLCALTYFLSCLEDTTAHSNHRRITTLHPSSNRLPRLPACPVHARTHLSYPCTHCTPHFRYIPLVPRPSVRRESPIWKCRASPCSPDIWYRTAVARQCTAMQGTARECTGMHGMDPTPRYRLPRLFLELM